MFKRLFFLFGAVSLGFANAPTPTPESSYKLYPLDQIRFSVFGEPDLNETVRISGAGEINLPLLGTIKVSGLTLAEAQNRIAEAYRTGEIFIIPQISLQIEEYSKKEISVFGQVGKQGKVLLPDESTTVTIVEAIAEAGGLTRIAKGDSVRVTRRDASGGEQTFTINVERLIQGQTKANEMFYVLPGDVIFVPERLI